MYRVPKKRHELHELYAVEAVAVNPHGKCLLFGPHDRSLARDRRFKWEIEADVQLGVRLQGFIAVNKDSGSANVNRPCVTPVRHAT